MPESFRLCSVDELAPGEARRFAVGADGVCLVRIGDDFYAIGDTCSHEDYSLAEGEVFTEELEIECWRHGSAFSLKTGEPNSLPATRPVPVYDVRVVGDDVIVERAT
jgi:3-phenylpropionate/trans-cinnamate dioxygenase ferredoxin component